MGQIIRMHQAEHELGCRQVAGHADDTAVDASVALDFYPVSRPPGRVAAIGALSHHALDARQELEPVLREVHVSRLLDELQAGMSCFEQPLELFATDRQRL